MSEIQLFNNGEFDLRVTTEADAFTVQAPGLARALGHRDANHMLANVPAEEKGYRPDGTAGGQPVSFVTEAGFYRVIGQRQPGRIKDLAIRAQVERFQNWVYRQVLPSIRKTGGYKVTQRVVEGNFFEPTTLTWDEATALIRQRYGIALTVSELTRMLRTAGVLKQNGAPRKEYGAWFWFTGSAWTVHPHILAQMAQKAYDIGRELQDFRFIQARLELEGVGQSFDATSARRLAA